MIIKSNKMICALLLPLLLTGCWDYVDINKRIITLSIGVDYVNDDIEFTGEIVKLSSNSSSGKDVMDVYNYESLGKDFDASRADFDAKVSAPDFSGATRLVVFSKKYAENKGIQSYINRLYSFPEIRNSVLITISEVPTRDIFKSKVENDISVSYAIEDAVRYLDKGGVALYKTTQEIFSDIQYGNIGYLVPYITIDKNVTKYLGLAAMKDSKLVGIIKREDSNGFLFVLSKKPTTSTTISNPNNEKNSISVTTTLSKRRIETSYEDNKINIYIYLKLNSQLNYQYFNIDPLNKEVIKKIEVIISNKIKEDVLAAVTRSQNEFQSDVFGFARYFKAQNPQAYKHIKWKDEYLNASFHLNVETTIKNTNLFDPNAKKPN
jgi:spore germination protein KC